MRTYTHGAVGYLLYLRGSARERALAAAGGIVPDLVLAVGYVPHLLEPRTSWPLVGDLHRLLHFGWPHAVTEAMHSFVVVGALLIVGRAAARPLVPVAVGMLAHAAADLLTHRTWPYNHLFPLPVEPVRSPISYTGGWFTVLEHVALAGFVAWCVIRWSARRRADLRLR